MIRKFHIFIVLIICLFLSIRGDLNKNIQSTDLVKVSLKSLLLITTLKGDIYGINSENGEEIWHTNLGESLLETHYENAENMHKFFDQLNIKSVKYPFLVPLIDGRVISYIPEKGFEVFFRYNKYQKGSEAKYSTISGKMPILK